MRAHRRTSVRSYRKRINGRVVSVTSHRRGYLAGSGRKHYRRDPTADPSFELRKLREARQRGADVEIVGGRVKTFIRPKDEKDQGFVERELRGLKDEQNRDDLIRRGIIPRNVRETFSESTGGETVNLQEAFRLRLSSKDGRIGENRRLNELRAKGIDIDPVSGLDVSRAKNLVNRADAFSRKTGNRTITPEEFSKSNFISFDKKGNLIEMKEAKKVEAKPSREKPKAIYSKPLDRQEAAERVIEKALAAREKGEKVKRDDVIKLGASRLVLPAESRQLTPGARKETLAAARAQAERIMDLEIKQRQFQQGFEKEFGPITGGKKVERKTFRSPFR